MISIKRSESCEEPAKANVLPCRIKYTGPASSSRQYWNPVLASPSEDKKLKTDSTEVKHNAYFRGRKLVGTEIVIPEGYSGYVVDAPSSGNPPSGQQKREMLYQDDDEDDLEVLESAEWVAKSSFSEIMLWGHEILVDQADDGIAKGVQEWITLSGALNGYSKTS